MGNQFNNEKQYVMVEAKCLKRTLILIGRIMSEMI